MIKYVLIFVVLISLGLFNACKKKDENSSPKVSVHVPFENQQFSAIDTILVQGLISDDKEIKYVTIKLLDLDMNVKSETVTIEVNAAEFNLSENFLLNEPELSGGFYYLTITAFDGELDRSAYIKIMLFELEKQLERVFVISNNNGSVKTHVSENDGEFTVFDSWLGDYAGSAISSFNDILLVSGRINSDLKIFDSSSGAQTGMIQNLSSSGAVYFNEINFNENSNQFFILYGDGNVQVYDRNFTELFMFPIATGCMPYYLSVFDQRMYVAQNANSSDQRLLGRYFSGGVFETSTDPGGETMGIFKRNVNQAFLWLNEGPDGKLKLLDLNNFLLNPISEWSNNKIHEVLQISTESFLVATEDVLYRYSYGSGNIVVLNNDLELERMVLDDVNGIIYGSNGNSLFLLNMNGQVISETLFPGQIEDIQLDFNL